MEDLEQQLMNTSDGENADVQAPPEQTSQEPSQEDIKTELSFLKEPEPAEPNPDTPPIQDLWKKTKQFEQGLWKTPDDIYIVPQNYTELYNKSILTKNYAKNKEAIDNFANKLLETQKRKSEIANLVTKRKDWGIAYRSASGNPELAIETLLREKQGFVPKAFYKEGIGDIDLVWGKPGKNGYGLAHILSQRKSDGLNEVEFVKRLPEIIKDGVIEKLPNQPNIVFIRNNDDSALVKMLWDDKSRKWILTAFKEK